MAASTLTEHATASVDHHALRSSGALVRTLLYFDIFQHPLRRAELVRFSAMPEHQVDQALDILVGTGIVEQSDDFFALARIDDLIQRRKEGEARASKRMTKARRMSRLIGSFPFVRGVMLSGSMSKGVLAVDGDIDYFIITAPGRLWVARTLLILYKKLLLFNSRRDFCVNYFVDTEHLPIEDRNLFTATEVATLVPTFGASTCQAFFEANRWAFQQFPNMGPATVRLDGEQAAHGRWHERLLSGRLGEHLDDLCMRLTFLRWKRKFGHLDARTFELALRTRKYVSKHHPRSFQQRVLGALDDRMRSFEQQHGFGLA